MLKAPRWKSSFSFLSTPMSLIYMCQAYHVIDSNSFDRPFELQILVSNSLVVSKGRKGFSKTCFMSAPGTIEIPAQLSE
jgi:hypothetical protein